ncbi:hypothetical protein FHS39_002636 [Streptomyces olivoverticillatus]|uniref:SH3 domain-containing protein n=1 Tax=Streptomyces olivoverticillatus TaxID=66427 RepID=A0A7W7LNR4_9ACTN|nr:SH3 domain-containing protein [Streptomyces olivoverticillatus]MBB4893605.1 hypothetical protein [Streptomyces olivoverticillatus]
MSWTFASRGGKLSAGLLAAAALGGSLLAVTPVHATPGPGTGTKPNGTVNAASGINERAYPSTDSSVRGVLKHNAPLALRCKVHAQDVGGNTLWYLLKDRSTWVSGKYIANAPDVPFCRSLNRSALDNSVESRSAMG